jgi:hypothetical protein
MSKVFKNDVGTKISLDVDQDLTEATVAKIKYVKPNGDTGYWTATIDDESIYYVTTVNEEKTEYDLDQVGTWTFFSYIETNAWSGHGEPVEMIVYPYAGVTVGDNSWVTIDEAEDYFETRYLSDEWVEASHENKIKALVSAYRQISTNEDYSFLETASDNMKYAQYEQALYLLKFGDSMERRASLQAQGVTRAGIVDENYKETNGGVQLCPTAAKLLNSYLVVDSGNCFTGDLERDEDD